MAEALARIARVEGLGMIAIRADLDRAGDAIAEAAGLALPGMTRIVTDGTRSLGWMSPCDQSDRNTASALARAASTWASVCSSKTSRVCSVKGFRVR